MLVSVIIPVYNVEKYIHECINSVLNQTYRNLEIILVDDGSTDSSGIICDKYASADDRIKLVHRKNGGLMSAWIAGLELANGEYVTFIDSDDWVEVNMIEKFVKCIAERKSDIVISNHLQEYENKSIPIKEKCASGVYDENAIVSKIYPVILNNGRYFGRGLQFSRCAKLIKTELIRNNLNYCNTKISYGEDINIMFPVFLDCKSIYILDDYLYHYRQNPLSIMHSYKRNMEMQIETLNSVLSSVNTDKKRFNFDEQIRNNFLCMVLALFRNEFSSNACQSEIINCMVKVSNKTEVRFVLTNNTLSKLSLFDKALIYGIKYNSRAFYYILLYAYRMKRIKSRFYLTLAKKRGKG